MTTLLNDPSSSDRNKLSCPGALPLKLMLIASLLAAPLLLVSSSNLQAQPATQGAGTSAQEPEQSAPNVAPKRAPDPKVEPWMRAGILDKGTIAEDTARRIVGLRESGNPHIVEGSALKGAIPAPILNDQELAELRERQIRNITRGRNVDWSPNSANSMLARKVEVEEPTPTALDTAEGNRWPAVVFGVGVVALLLVIRKRRHH